MKQSTFIENAKINYLTLNNSFLISQVKYNNIIFEFENNEVNMITKN